MRGTRDNMDTLEKEIQRSIDRYYKWLIELCQRTTGMDPSLSGERIGRLRRRRDREFDRLMHHYSALSVHAPRRGSIQITGRANYKALARDAGLPVVAKGARSD